MKECEEPETVSLPANEIAFLFTAIPARNIRYRIALPRFPAY
jgi:hypothetical protein